MENVTELRGIIFKIKVLKDFNFILIDCDQGIVQSIYNGLLPENIKEQSSVILKGGFTKANIKDEFVSLKSEEFVVNEITMLSTPFETMPFDITKKELNINNDVLFDLRAISLRHPKIKAVFKIQEGIVRAFRDFFYSKGFSEIRTPKIVKSGAEGGANIFELNYFGEKAYLTQSPQFYKEFLTGVFQSVFEVGPVFRAEKHNTSRHLNEYTSMDIEFSPLQSFEEIMNLEEELLNSIMAFLKEKYARELELLKIGLPVINKIPRIKFKEAKKLLLDVYQINEEDDDLSPLEELKLCEYIKDKFQSEFVFVTHYPEKKRPFYAMNSLEEAMMTDSFDLLFRGVEITTGGQRIHNYEDIIEKMKKRGMSPSDFDFFTTAHRYGLPPHGGFGMGLERLTQKLVGLNNVKEATMFPRDISRLTP